MFFWPTWFGSVFFPVLRLCYGLRIWKHFFLDKIFLFSFWAVEKTKRWVYSSNFWIFYDFFPSLGQNTHLRAIFLNFEQAVLCFGLSNRPKCIISMHYNYEKSIWPTIGLIGQLCWNMSHPSLPGSLRGLPGWLRGLPGWLRGFWWGTDGTDRKSHHSTGLWAAPQSQIKRSLVVCCVKI